MIKKVLSIAGSDSGGGAGIQADLKTFEEYGVFGISSITSILSVEPQQQKPHIFPIPIEIVAEQLQTAYSGGALDAVKIGLLGSLDVIELLENQLKKYQQTNIVLDPVMAVKTENSLLQPELVQKMKEKLLPLANVVTPNLVEAQILSGIKIIDTKELLIEAAQLIHALGPRIVVIKGGARFPGEIATDLIYDGTNFSFMNEPKIITDTNHGAGCSFAAAITAGLGKGLSSKEAIITAKKYVTSAIQHGIYLNKFTGYVWHGAYQQAEKRITEGVSIYEN